MSYINKEHLSCYLSKSDKEDKVTEIKKWQEEEMLWIEQ